MAERLDAYLRDLRSRLRGMPDDEAAEIVEELRSHVRDSTPSGARIDGEVAAVLERFGPAEELASLYMRDRVLARAGRGGSPWLLLTSVFKWATLGVGGFFTFMGLLTGYVISMSFFIAALRKPFAPDRVGLWRVGDAVSLRLGLGSPMPGEELLGFWIVPIGLLTGAFGLWLTTWAGRWCIRSLRRPPIPRTP